VKNRVAVQNAPHRVSAQEAGSAWPWEWLVKTGRQGGQGVTAWQSFTSSEALSTWALGGVGGGVGRVIQSFKSDRQGGKADT
jgi:hypothetical protein